MSSGRVPITVLLTVVMTTVTRAGLAQPSPSPDATAGPSAHGTVLDFTHNHGHDHRVYSPALGEKRDLYIYLPPHYQPSQRYPFLLWLHGYMADERQALYTVIPALERAVQAREIAPLVAAFPDGSLTGDFHFLGVGSWWMNSPRGRFRDYVVHDVVRFVERNFSIASDCRQRAVAGWSMGGFAAYNIAFTHPDRFSLIAGISPPLNLRYVGCDGDYFRDFHPACWRMRFSFSGHDVVGRYWGGLLKVRAWWVVYPVWGRGSAAVERILQENPTDLLLRQKASPEHQRFFVAYGKADEMNTDAQIESFLFVARQKNVTIDAIVYPDGTHSEYFMARVAPHLLLWLGEQLRHREMPTGPANK